MRNLRLENHRFGQQITWDIAVDPDLDDEEIQVPSMFLQPFAENAILHGLAPKGGGHIEIRIEQRDGHLCCTLRDNGVGRHAKPDAPTPNNAPKRASVGMRLIAERLDAFAGLQGGQAEVLVRDLKDAEGGSLGTDVEVRVPVRRF